MLYQLWQDEEDVLDVPDYDIDQCGGAGEYAKAPHNCILRRNEMLKNPKD